MTHPQIDTNNEELQKAISARLKASIDLVREGAPTDEAKKALDLLWHVHLNSFPGFAHDLIKSRDQQIALAALEDLRGEFAHDIDLESAYDYDYQIAESTIKAHNKIISAKNAERADVRAAIDERLATLKAQEKS